MTLAKIGNTTYSTLAAAALAVNDGQTVSILRHGAGAEATAAFTKAGTFKIMGVPDKTGLPKLQLDPYTRPAFSKGVINLEDGNYEICFVHLDGATIKESNASGIRTNPGTDVVKVHHVRITNNENGILTGDGGELYIWDSVFDGNGKASDQARRGQSHNLYAGNQKRVEALRTSFINSEWGHDLKSRAQTTILTQVLCAGAKMSRALDLPNGGVLEATDCKFSKDASAGQNNLIDIGAEGIPAGRVERYVLRNCHFHNDVAINRDVQFILNRSKVEVLLIDPLFTGAAASKSQKNTLVGNIRIELTGGPLGPRVPVGGDPGATSTAPVPEPTLPVTPAPTPAPTTPAPTTPTPAPTPAPTTPAPTGDWRDLVDKLLGDPTVETTLNISIKPIKK